MPTTTIQVKSVRQPDKFPKFGSIQDTSGNYWSVPAGILGQFLENSQATVEYDTTEKNGKTYRNVKKMVVAGVPPVSPMAVAPSRTVQSKDEDISVLAIVKSYIEAGCVPLGTAELDHALWTAYGSWMRFQERKKLKPLPSKIESGLPAEFDDQIPEF